MNTQTPVPEAPRSLGHRSGSRIGVILHKEFREIFRDKRTIFSVIISPLVMTPLLFWLMGTMINSQMNKGKADILNVGIVGNAKLPTMLDSAAEKADVRFQPITQPEAEARIKDRRLQVAAILPDDTEALVDKHSAVSVKILLDAGRDSSRDAAGRLERLFEQTGAVIVSQRLKDKGLPTDFAKPFKVEEQPISGGGSMATMMLAMLLPYTLAVAAFGGGIYAANDQVAGEKERGTLETLLASPASRKDIVLGKFLAVAGVCLVSSFLSVVGLMIPFFSHLKAFDWLAKGGVSLTPMAIAVTLIMQLPLAVLFAGILLAISTFAKNQKEAQTYLAPLFILVLLPAMMSMFVKTEAAKTLSLIPVLNSTLIIKQALSGVFDMTFIALAFAASAFYAALALIFATRLFQKEGVLVKT